jgi:hypothetical protein
MKSQNTHLRRIKRGAMKGWDPVPLSSQETIKSKVFLVVLGKRGRK